MAVLSHGLLNRVAAILDTADRLTTMREWSEDAERMALLGSLRAHARWIADVLQTAARGLPHDVLIALDRQAPAADLRRPERYGDAVEDGIAGDGVKEVLVGQQVEVDASVI